MEPLPAGLVDALKDSHSYPGVPASVEYVQTHISHVFIVENRVYKFRKAVRFPFVDFSTVEARHTDCLREVELNSRLAPDVYLGVASVRFRDNAAVVAEHVRPPQRPPEFNSNTATTQRNALGGAQGAAQERQESEWAVVMRRLPAKRDFLSLLEQQALPPTALVEAAEQLAAFHKKQSLPETDQAWSTEIERPVRETLEELRGLLPKLGLSLRSELEHGLAEAAAQNASLLERRRRAGRAVDGHGDLHLDHGWVDEDGSVRIIDCLEFDDALRRNDAAGDVAFLTMDLRYRGREDLAELFITHYAEAADDYALFELLPYFESYRAAVRGKVAALAALDLEHAEASRAAARESCARRLELASKSLEVRPPSQQVVALCGTVGSGKSTVAARIAEAIQGVRLRTDGIRKRQQPIDASDSDAAWGTGAYSDEARGAIYKGLIERAQALLDSGRPVVLDASFSERRWRDHLRTWCTERGITPRLIEVTCPKELALERLMRRSAEGLDPSDAGPGHLEASYSHYEAPLEWPDDRRWRVDTTSQEWQEQVDTLGSQWTKKEGGAK